MPVKMHISVAPCVLIPTNTWTLSGCLGRGLFVGFSPFFRQHLFLCVSSWIEDSSLNITFSKQSPWFHRAHSNLFCLFSFWISWQYRKNREMSTPNTLGYATLNGDTWIHRCVIVAPVAELQLFHHHFSFVVPQFDIPSLLFWMDVQTLAF